MNLHHKKIYMLTTVYNIAQVTETKSNQIIVGLSGYTLTDEPTKIGYGLPSLPTKVGYLKKGDESYEQHNNSKTVLQDYIIGSLLFPKTDTFFARAKTLLNIVRYTQENSDIVIVAEINSFENVFKNYTERSDEFLDKVKKGIELGHEVYEGINFADVADLVNQFKTSLNGRSVVFYVRKPYEEKSNYGIKLAQITADWSINCCKEIPLERLDYLPQEERLELPTLISDYPRAYFNSRMDTLANSNSYYLTRINTSEEDLLGCRINDVSYCYLETQEPLKEVDASIDIYRSLNHYTDLHISRIDINALKSKGQRYFTDRGLYRAKDSRKGPAPMGHMHGLVMLDPSDQIVINDIVPTGLSTMIADHFKELIDIKRHIKDGLPFSAHYPARGEGFEVISVKDYFFESEVKKDKVKYKLKKEFSVGSKSTNIIIFSEQIDRNVSFPLFFGYDCYSRNALARFADELIDFSIVLYERSPGNYRYATLLETHSLVAVVATCHANKLYIFSVTL